ncbi:diacylglycerol kinase [Spongiibacter sp. IMCC21906]|jgi:diacylglycerol kinase (ATP)|uniref:diacylglycerol kinase n=1 Tax=Spongiibacter sp. IMCC21906 TaxID=1620392 RepID=UPI00062DD4C8|nr:diacylglycerol kinase [Spongiibacter sp. IMCC21906]
MMNKPGRSGFSRIAAATEYSIKGLRAAWHHEEAFRQEAIFALIMLPLAFWLGQGATQTGLLIASVVLLVVVELINSAIEAAIDRIGSERHPLSGQAKDIGSAAVMITLLLCFTVWGLVIAERLSS